MALQIDSTSNSGEVASVSSATWAHTCSGKNRILVVGVNARGLISDTNTTVSSVTYAGVNMTYVGGITSDSGDTFRGRSEIWYIVAPTVGSNNVIVTWSGNIDFACNGALSLNGAIQDTAVIDSHNGYASQTDTTPSVDVTVVANGCLLIDSAFSRSTPPFTKDASQTLVMNVSVNAAGDGTGMSYKFSTGKGTQTMAWTSGAEEVSLYAVAIKPISKNIVTNINGGVSIRPRAFAPGLGR